MARIAGVDLPQNKRIFVGLTYIFGIGRTRAGALLALASVDPMVKVKDMTEEEARRLRKAIQDGGSVEGDLRKEIAQNVRRLQEIGCYRGVRHSKGLPVRGQRTHTNARTRKGPRRATIAGKKKVAK